MFTADKVIKIAKSFVRAKPYGDSNIFNNHNGEYWCAYFVRYIAKKAGKDWMKAIHNSAYCPNIKDWAKEHHRWTLHPKKGDLILFDWNSNNSPDHVGYFIKKVRPGLYMTVEGNTSNASNGNGGCVQIRYREAKWVLGFVRPPYSKVVKKPAKQPSTKLGYKGSFPTLKDHGDGLYLGLGDRGSEVKKLQKFLNWYLGHGLKVDGDFGAMTRRAVLEWQESQKLEKTGLFGKTSLGIAKKVTK